MKHLLNPNDWLGRHPAVCLVLIGVLVLAQGALAHA